MRTAPSALITKGLFPRNHTGQRLVCGLSIGPHSGNFATRMTIVDPEPEEPFKVRPRDMGLAEDAAERGVLAKALIPTCIDQNSRAHLRRPMVMMRQG